MENAFRTGINTVREGTKAVVSGLVIINDKLFAKSFINIWLGQETSEPELRSAPLGKGNQIHNEKYKMIFELF